MFYFLRNYPDSKKVKQNSMNFWSRKREIVYKLDISVLKTCGFMIYSMKMLNIWILNPKSQRTYALVSTRQSWFMVFLGLNINSNPFHLKKNPDVGVQSRLFTPILHCVSTTFNIPRAPDSFWLIPSTRCRFLQPTGSDIQTHQRHREAQSISRNHSAG